MPGGWPDQLSFLRPYSLTVGTVILFGVWLWVAMSTADYRPGRFGGGRETAGWFVLGSPMIVGFALLPSALFTFVALRTRPVVGWSFLLAVAAALTVLAFVQTTPAARLMSALGVEPPAGTRIQFIRESDSFNGGRSTWGVCTADPQFVDRLIAARGLNPSDSAATFLHQVMANESMPADRTVFTGDRLAILYDADRSLLFFGPNYDQ